MTEPPIRLLAKRYELERELGRGGQGAVYLASDLKLRRRVAVKLFHRGAFDDPVTAARFRREADVLSRLDHPNLCAIFDSGVDDGQGYLVMRFVEGATFAAWMNDSRPTIVERDAVSPTTAEPSEFVSIGSSDAGRPALEGAARSAGSSTLSTAHRSAGRELMGRVLGVVEEVARALHTAHESGVVHRDVKPGNIMIGRDGRPVLLDFGLAQDDEAQGAGLTVSGDFLGTPAYMAPEQIDGERGKVDRRTDVYALGVVLFEALAGSRPFAGATRAILLREILEKPAPGVVSLNPAVSHDLAVVVATAIAKEKRDRYQTAADLAEDIRRVRTFEPILAVPPGPIRRTAQWTRRNPKLAAALATIFLVLAAGVATTTAFWRESEMQRGITESVNRDYERLADMGRLDDLRRDFDELLPDLPERSSAITSWIKRAEAIRDRGKAHRTALEALRHDAEPFDPADRARDEEMKAPDRLRLRQVEAGLADLKRQIAALPDEADEAIEDEMNARRRDLETERSLLETRLKTRRVYRFSTDERQFRHEKLVELVEDAASLDRTAPGVASIPLAMRLERTARSLESVGVEDYRDRWEIALKSIAANPRYAGLALKEQTGLVPLRQNEAGLMEFVHLPTGRMPDTGGPNGDGLRLSPETGIILILLPGGRFRFGSSAAEAGRLPEEPDRDVEIDAFFISKFEVTQAQWRRVMEENPSFYHPGTDDRGVPLGRPITPIHPVESVSWLKARRFAALTGLDLPTEAQWEYAARGGRSTPYPFGDSIESLNGNDNVSDAALKRYRKVAIVTGSAEWDDGFAVHAPVAVLGDNGFGLVAVAGNVAEWCRDRYGPIGADTVLEGDGLNAGAIGEERSLRGASWLHGAASGRTAERSRLAPETRAANIGLRPIRRVSR